MLAGQPNRTTFCAMTPPSPELSPVGPMVPPGADRHIPQMHDFLSDQALSAEMPYINGKAGTPSGGTMRRPGNSRIPAK